MEERLSRKRFIKLGAALGVGVASAPVLAACGGGQASGPSGGGTTGAVEGAAKATGSATGPAEVQRGSAIAREADVPRDSAVEFTDQESGQEAVLVHLESSDFVAYSAICTHRGCTVAYRDGRLACPCHGSVFNPAQGAAVEAGPAPRPLPNIPVEVRNGEIVRA